MTWIVSGRNTVGEALIAAARTSQAFVIQSLDRTAGRPGRNSATRIAKPVDRRSSPRALDRGSASTRRSRGSFSDFGLRCQLARRLSRRQLNVREPVRSVAAYR